jgi:hypothetical protein
MKDCGASRKAEKKSTANAVLFVSAIDACSARGLGFSDVVTQFAVLRARFARRATEDFSFSRTQIAFTHVVSLNARTLARWAVAIIKGSTREAKPVIPRHRL